MKAEYKRDMNHNYLILYGENEIHTDSYQVRMLVGNVIPSLLKCRIQGMDGKFLVYFDITSRQSLSTLYEDKKFGVEDLKLIFGGFVQAMEDAAEYLMNPGQMVISPEYIFVDMEKKKIYFCLMPGYEKDIREQFQALTEYILPKIDHEDGDAVILGYGVYRRGMEDSFHLEHIKEELYKTQGQEGRSKENRYGKITGRPGSTEGRVGDIAENIAKAMTGETEKEESGQNGPEEWEDENYRRKVFQEEDAFGEVEAQEFGRNFMRENIGKENEGRMTGNISVKKVGIFLGAFVILAGVLTAIFAGYLPYTEAGTLLGIILVGMGAVMLISVIVKKRKNKTYGNESNNNDIWKEQKNSDIREEHENLNEIQNKDHNKDKNKDRQSFTDRGFKERGQEKSENYGETVVLSAGIVSGPASLVSREPGELAPIYLNEDLTVIGKLENACDAVINLPTVSRIHAKIRKREDAYYLTDMNSRNGTVVNGKLLLPDEEYQLQPEDEVDFAQARYIFLE